MSAKPGARHGRLRALAVNPSNSKSVPSRLGNSQYRLSRCYPMIDYVLEVTAQQVHPSSDIVDRASPIIVGRGRAQPCSAGRAEDVQGPDRFGMLRAGTLRGNDSA